MECILMAVYTEELNTNYNFTNINIFNILKDGVLNGYKAIPYDGYVMYSPTNDVITLPPNPETGEETTEIYYGRQAILPLNYNWGNFDYIAVLESEVPADHIFGNDEPEHEVM